MALPKETTPKQPVPSVARIGTASTMITLSTGLGAGISAAIRGGDLSDIVASASVAGLGTGSIIAGFGAACRFGFFREESRKPPSTTDMFIAPALTTLVGATIGYAGTKLFIDAAVSTAPLVDAAFGLPVSIAARHGRLKAEARSPR